LYPSRCRIVFQNILQSNEVAASMHDRYQLQTSELCDRLLPTSLNPSRAEGDVEVDVDELDAYLLC
jgi:hypothetical protein